MGALALQWRVVEIVKAGGCERPGRGKMVAECDKLGVGVGVCVHRNLMFKFDVEMTTGIQGHGEAGRGDCEVEVELKGWGKTLAERNDFRLEACSTIKFQSWPWAMGHADNMRGTRFVSSVAWRWRICR